MSDTIYAQGITEAYWLDKVMNVPVAERQPLWLMPDEQSSALVITPGQKERQGIDKISRGNAWGEFSVFAALYALAIYKLGAVQEGLISCAAVKEGGPVLFFRFSVQKEQSLKELIRALSKEIAESVENADYDAALLFSQLKSRGTDIEKQPCFGIVDNRLTQQKIAYPEPVFCLYIDESSFSIKGASVYGNRIAEGISTLLGRLDSLLDTAVMDIHLLAAAAEEMILTQSRGPLEPVAEDKTFNALFEAQVSAHPGVLALVYKERQWTYDALNRQANALAHYLLNDMQAAPGSRVGILLERSDVMLVSVLAVLKAGGVYVPLDVHHPWSRLSYIISEAGISTLITSSDNLMKLEGYEGQAFITDLQMDLLNAEEKSPAITVSGDMPAYIIYTSGSTGRPKGVIMHHHAIINLVTGLQRDIYRHYGQGLQVGLLAPLIFDPSVQQIFAAWLGGHTLHVAAEEVRRSGPLLWQFLAESNIDLCDGTPSHLQLLSAVLHVPDKLALKHLLIGGEALTVPVLQQFLDKLPLGSCNISNLYGLTECGVDNTSWTIDTSSLPARLPIGRPLANQQVYVLNSDLQLLPEGIPGEIYIGGENVGKGYVNAELTKQRFVPDPFQPGKSLFKTGDIGILTGDGLFALIGRSDHQIKVRGYRVEPAEITAAILRLPGIQQCITVAARESDGSAYLASYVVSAAVIEPKVLAEALSEQLPAYMIPAFFVQLKQLPLTYNGKIDQAALPDPNQSNITEVKKKYEAPSTLMEIIMAGLWTKLLDKKDPDIHDNFFEAGGHSLKATQLVMWVQQTLNVNLTVIDIFNYPVLKDLAAHIENMKNGTQQQIPKAVAVQGHPLSFGQQRLWVLHQMEPELIAYNMVNRYLIKGLLFPDKLQAAMEKLTERHEILRTTFSESGGTPVQVVHRTATGGFQYEDLRGTDERIVMEKATALAMEPFDLEKGPLFKMQIWRTGEEQYLLQLLLHHIIADGWSFNIIIKELLQWYKGRVEGLAPVFKVLPIQYKDYASWQQQQLKEGHLNEQGAYWLQKLAGELPVLKLPFEKKRPAIKQYKGAAQTASLPNKTRLALQALSLEEDASLFMIMMAAFSLLLHKYTGQTDLITGSPMSGRLHPDLEDQVGFYANALPLRIQLSPAQTLSSLIAQVRETLLEAYENQAYPFDLLVEKLGLKRDPAHHPVFDFMIVMQTIEDHQQILNKQGGTSIESLPAATVTNQFDLVLRISEEPDHIALVMEYDSAIFEAAAIRTLLQHYCRLLENLVPDAPLDEHVFLSEKEQHQLAVSFNDSQADFPDQETLISLFEKQAVVNPSAVAVVDGDNEYTFEQLNIMAGSQAAFLQQQELVKEGDIVGLMTGRSVHMITGMLAILKLGAAYLPVDATYPLSRIRYMLADASVKVLLTDLDYPAEDLPGVQLYVLPDMMAEGTLHPLTGASLPAYIIYTSGSTGEPKGVIMEHKGVVNRLCWMWEVLGFSTADVVLQKTSFTFDVSVWEIFLPLCFGAKMVLCSKEKAADPEALAAMIRMHHITTVHFVPNMYTVFLKLSAAACRQLTSLKRIICSGDLLPVHTVDNHYKYFDIPLYNLYGPTEAAIDVTYYKTVAGEEAVPIGKPVWNTRIFILDSNKKPVPVGVKGELFIEGVQLAKGYINKRALSDEKFCQVFDGKSWCRMYASGDLGYWRSDGNIMVDGRIDQQVKIRGYRVETGETEAALRTYPGIEDAVVTAERDADGISSLMAYYTASAAIDTDALVTALASLLPDYMIPSRFCQMQVFPLNASGKVDRKALAGMEKTSTQRRYVAPLTDTEKAVAAIWEQVLEKEQIGLEDSFFDLGGHSLKAVQIISRMQNQLHIKVVLRDLFLRPSIAALLRKVPVDINSIRPAPKSTSYPVSHAQKRLWVLHQLDQGQQPYNMTGRYMLTGAVSLHRLEQSFSRMIRRHEILRTSFDTLDEIPVQIIKETLADWWYTYDFSADENGYEAAVEMADRETNTAFDLVNGPLLKVSVWKIADNKYIMQLMMHHIISDAWSMDIMVEELGRLYRNETDTLAALKIQYKDYAVWQTKLLEQGLLNTQRDYWHQQLSGEIPLLNLPADHPRAKVQTFRGNMLTLAVDEQLSGRLDNFARKNDCTLFMLLLTVVKVLLYRYTDQTDMVIGMPIAGRLNADLEKQLGFYVNTLPLRSRFNENDRFTEVLQKVKKVALEAYANQAYPFDLLVEELNIARDMSRNPVFDVMVNMQNRKTLRETENIGIDFSSMERAHYSSMFDLWFSFDDQEQGLSISIEYNTDLFSDERIKRLGTHFVTLCEEVLNNEQSAVNRLNYMSSSERKMVLEGFNNTAVPFNKDATVIRLFEDVVRRIPTQDALIFKGQALSFAALNEKANRLAHLLVREYGIGRNMPVALQVQRSEWLIICILGILKAGGAYVPIVPGAAVRRSRFMLEDSGTALIITDTAYHDELDLQVLTLEELQSSLQDYPDHNPESGTVAEDLIYIMYTSGSTGVPKGCKLMHRGIVNRIEWMWKQYEFSAADIILQKTTFVFDVSVWEIFLPLCFGAGMVVCSDDEVYSHAELVNLITAHGVSTMHFVPSVLQVFLDSLTNTDLSRIQSLRHVFASGEALPLSTAEKFIDRTGIALYNLYGPTEASVDVTATRVWPGQPRILIGKPIANTVIYILDKQLLPVAVGIAGEIYIGGVGLASAYTSEALSAERFIPNPFNKGTKLYKTGDIGSRTPEGALYFIGRADAQIKIRGFRIEPAEIELALSGDPFVHEAKVVSINNELLAYFIPDHASVNSFVEQKSFIPELEHTTEWSAVFDAIYKEAGTGKDKSFNISGWHSSYTGLPFTEQEMREWVDALVQKVAAYHPLKMLEVGCGTGLLLYRLAPQCRQYVGTDISYAALEGIREYIAEEPKKWQHVQLHQLAANELATLEGSFDTILLNSVIQYFPSAQYLREVLQQCHDLLSAEGRIIVGDVRSLPLLEKFHQTVAMHKSADAAAVNEMMLLDKELAVAPAFFLQLKEWFSDLINVEITPKEGVYDNELNNFRYEVVLEFGKVQEKVPVIQWYDWDARHQLVPDENSIWGISHVPRQDAAVTSLISEMTSAGYAVAKFWARHDSAGYMDLVISRHKELLSAAYYQGLELVPAESLTSLPLKEKLYRKSIIPGIRARLQELLPDYMVPAQIIPLDEFPLTANGKLDIRRLPAQLKALKSKATDLPETEMQQQVALIWQDVLGLQQIGINDNFFEAGGQSLKAIQVISRINTKLNISIKLMDLFAFPSVKMLADKLEQLMAADIIMDESDQDEAFADSILI